MFFYSMVFLWFFAQNGAGEQRESLQISNVLDSRGTAAQGGGSEAVKRMPKPPDISEEMTIFKTISKMCFLFMSSGSIRSPEDQEIDSMSLKLFGSRQNLNFPLNSTEKILQSPEFDINKRVVIFVTGWMSSSESDYVADMAHAYSLRGNYNFLALNSSHSIETVYTWSAYNTVAVGRELATGLQKLLAKVPADNIHLIGHSLGAHIVGSAGRYFTEKTGYRLTRITGLDPANPCFNEGHILSGLQRGDALFIDVIHTNNGVLGKSYSVGDVDFYPGGKAPLQHGCTNILCSHNRAFEYYTESVYPGNEHNFLGIRCTSLTGVNLGLCKGKKFPMGYAVPHDLKGNFYLSVNSKKPFGQNNSNQN